MILHTVKILWGQTWFSSARIRLSLYTTLAIKVHFRSVKAHTPTVSSEHFKCRLQMKTVSLVQWELPQLSSTQDIAQSETAAMTSQVSPQTSAAVIPDTSLFVSQFVPAIRTESSRSAHRHMNTLSCIPQLFPIHKINPTKLKKI